MEKLFKLKQNGTTVKTEMLAGLTTFLSMVYILAVNPNILSAAGMEAAGVFTATAVSAAIACLSVHGAVCQLSGSPCLRYGS